MSTPQGFFGESKGSRADQTWGGLLWRYIGVGVWMAVPDPIRSVTMTGAAVDTEWPIPRNFRLIRIEIKHTVAAGTDGTDATAYVFRYRNPITDRLYTFYADTAVTGSDTVVSFGKGFEFPVSGLYLSANTTNTDLIFPVFTLQEVRRDL